jgi:ribonuclease G
MNKELYVSTTPHETKVALVEDDQLAEVYFERENEYTLAGSIYKGRVTRVLPGMQSAFVDVGLERDAFLYVSDFLELQDEDDDSEFGDVKVTGATLAQANGLIITEPQPTEEEDYDESPDEAVDAVADADTAADKGESKDDAGAPRWRGRRRRRGRRGGRNRLPEDRPAAEAQPGATDAAAWTGLPPDDFEEAPAERQPESAPPPRKRELRGFEPRGLVVHGLARSVSDDEVEPATGNANAAGRGAEVEAAEEPATEAKSAAPASSAYTPMLLPGESISKYNRADGEAPAPAPAADSSAGEESDRGYGRGRERDRDRGGRGGRGRDRDRGRGRGDRGDREPREPRESESIALPENYTPIVLPGESISKYRGVEPTGSVGLTDWVEPANGEPVEAILSEAEPADGIEPTASLSPDAHSQPGADPEVNPGTDPAINAATNAAEPLSDEPLSSASYSGVSSLPSLTQRHTAEAADVEAPEVEAHDVEPEAAEVEAHEVEPHDVAVHDVAFEATNLAVPEAAEPAQEPVLAEPATTEPADLQPAESAAFEAHTPDSQVEAAPEAIPEGADESLPPGNEAKTSGRGRRSWRDRVSKIFGAHEEGAATNPEINEHATSPDHENFSSPVEPAAESHVPAERKPAHVPQLGSFVIEGGHVEHEELDEDEAEMPALAEHFDRYEESEIEEEGLDDANGSQIGAAVRESGEESDLEDDEYDFGGEEFEESELLAEEEVGDDDEGDESEESDEQPIAAAPESPTRQRPERFERRERRGRRGAPPTRGGGRMRPRQQSRALPLISELLKEGQEILVQIAKEPIGKKGARITSHIALPGRFLVYMPTVNHIGVSRKISSEEERQRLKRIVSSERENGHGGFIVRTAAANIKEDELRADIRFLKHLWTEIRTRAESSKSPSLIYHDLNLVERILRDQVTSDFSQIWVDNEGEYERVVRFASRFQPNLVRRIKLYTKDTPLYDQFGINEEVNKSLKSKVWLKSGGYIVINQTEALVAIDINTGKYVGKTARLEDTIVKTNCDAVKEIVRQIRLRDLGGIIVVDFIDMDERKNRQKVMQALEEAMKSDRAPSKILQFNDFGLVAITRKRVKQSLERTLGTPCPYCDATGFVKSVQTVCNEIYVEMRKVRRHVESKEVILRVNPEVAKELKGGNGKWLQEMEELIGHPVLVKSDALLHQEQFDMNY